MFLHGQHFNRIPGTFHQFMVSFNAIRTSDQVVHIGSRARCSPNHLLQVHLSPETARA